MTTDCVTTATHTSHTILSHSGRDPDWVPNTYLSPSLHPEVDPEEWRGPVLLPLHLVQAGPEGLESLERFSCAVLLSCAGIHRGVVAASAELHISEDGVSDLDMDPLVL